MVFEKDLGGVVWLVRWEVGWFCCFTKKQREGKHGTDFLKAFKFEGNPLNLHCGV